MEELSLLGCKNTSINSLTYTDSKNVTTAYDLAIVSSEYIKSDLFSKTSKTVYQEFCPRNEGASPFAVYCTNSLVSNYRHSSYLYRYAYGLKEAFASADDTNHIVTLLKNGNKEFLLVLADAKPTETEATIYTDTKKLGNYAFESFSTKTLIASDEPVTECLVENAPKGTHIVLKASEQKSAFLPTTVSSDEIEKKVVCNDAIRAPISKGDVLGEISFYFRGNLLGNTPLYSDRAVEYHPTVSGAGIAYRILTHPITIVAVLGFIVLFVALFLHQIQVSKKKARKKGKTR